MHFRLLPQNTLEFNDNALIQKGATSINIIDLKNNIVLHMNKHKIQFISKFIKQTFLYSLLQYFLLVSGEMTL